MALRQSQQLKLTQKFLPQQILMMRLLQLPVLALEDRIKEELVENPALEERDTDTESPSMEDGQMADEAGGTDEVDFENDVDFEEFMDDDARDLYKYDTGYAPESSGVFEPSGQSAQPVFQYLTDQVHLLQLDSNEAFIAEYIIGSLDEDGYLRRGLDMIADDLLFNFNLKNSIDVLEAVLKKIQSLDPPGIAARNVQECLLLQLQRKDQTREIQWATTLVKRFMEELIKKNYDRIQKRTGMPRDELKAVIHEIEALQPRPGMYFASGSERQDIVPDIVVQVESQRIELSLNGRQIPDLAISQDYIDMLDAYKKAKDAKSKEAAGFVKSKIEQAQWFIDALGQRQRTLIRCVKAITDAQRKYLLSGDPADIRPLLLKDIAALVELDLSTVSRVVNSKYIQTPYGTLLLKQFFSEGMQNQDGEDVSTTEIKTKLKAIIEQENKNQPLSDDALCAALQKLGYPLARRTVAKYREALNIPVARLRKVV
ncbi:MAG: RNA polymerase factor sigma-54 [Bacteroidia bacterium]